MTLLAPACELTELATVGEGKHLRFRVPPGGRSSGRAGDRLPVRRAARPLPPGRPLRRRIQPGGEPLERHGHSTTRRQGGARLARGVHAPLRIWLKEEFGKPETERDSAAAAIFAELGLANGASRRSLLESEAFRKAATRTAGRARPEEVRPRGEGEARPARISHGRAAERSIWMRSRATCSARLRRRLNMKPGSSILVVLLPATRERQTRGVH